MVGQQDAATFVDHALHVHGLRRTVAVQVPDFAGALFVVATSDLVLTAPTGLGEAARDRLGLTIGPHPLPLSPTHVLACWHARDDQDKGLVWLRSVIRTMLQRALVPPSVVRAPP